MPCATRYRVMATRLSDRESRRDSEACLTAQTAKRCRMGSVAAAYQGLNVARALPVAL